jgi:hypothetical protein
MLNNIKEDLKVFNELIEVFLEDEKLNPISENIKSYKRSVKYFTAK